MPVVDRAVVVGVEAAIDRCRHPARTWVTVSVRRVNAASLTERASRCRRVESPTATGRCDRLSTSMETARRERSKRSTAIGPPAPKALAVAIAPPAPKALAVVIANAARAPRVAAIESRVNAGQLVAANVAREGRATAIALPKPKVTTSAIAPHAESVPPRRGMLHAGKPTPICDPAVGVAISPDPVSSAPKNVTSRAPIGYH